MATVFWSALTNEQVIPFNPANDLLHFNDSEISAADIRVPDAGPGYIMLSVGAITVTLLTDPFALTSTNVVFDDGSILVVGDDDVSTAGDDGPNVVDGGGGDDFLVGAGGDDSVFGAAGNDALLLVGGAADIYGEDTLNGGEGSDTLLYDFEADFGVNVNLAAGTAAGGDGIAPGSALTLIDIENAVGTQHDDTITGNAEQNTLEGKDGADILDGGSNDDVLEGGEGADTLIGGSGSDTLDYSDSPNGVIVNMFGPTGGSVILGTTTVVGATAGDGHNSTDSISGMENVIGSAFNDYVQGGSTSSNVLDGAAGNDTLIGSGSTETVNGAQHDTLLGGAGDDTLRQTRGNDVIDGGDGFNDRLEFLNSTNPAAIQYGSGLASVHVDLGEGFSNADRTNVDTMHGSEAGDDIAAISGIERVIGTAGHDLLVGGSFATASSGSFSENFSGGAGNDTVDGDNSALAETGVNDSIDYSDSLFSIIVNLGEDDRLGTLYGTVAGGTARDGWDSLGGGTDTLIDINQVVGSSFSDTLIGGNPLNDFFERFQGNAGNDYIDGGSGTDEAAYNNNGVSTGVIVNLDDEQNFFGLVTIEGGMAFDGFGGVDELVSIERVRGSRLGDALFGSDDAKVFETFIGEGGNDVIDGGAGIDFASWQTMSLANGGVNVFLQGGSGTVSHINAGTDTLFNIEGLTGTNSGDTLRGGQGNQWFRGRGGEDILNGGVGTDTADYSTDSLGVIVNLGENNVVVDMGDGDGNETVTGGTARDGWGGIYAMGGVDELISIENVRGSRFDDHITGSAGANVLDGAGGNDTLTGGAGRDRFYFTTAATAGNADVITDFVSGEDQIRLDGSRLDGLTLNGRLDPTLFGAGSFSVAQDATQRIVHNTGTGEVFYDKDGAGGTAAVKILDLGIGTDLAAADFLVYDAAGGGTHFWTILTNTQEIDFNPDTDQLNFDDFDISAAEIVISDADDFHADLTFGGITVTLNAGPNSFTSTNIVFDDGSFFIIGDNTTGVLADQDDNTLVGGDGDDQLIPLDGHDSVVGGGGDDLIGVVADGPTGIGNDSIDGGAGSDTLFYLFSVNDAVINLASGTATGADDAGSILKLTSVENVIAAEANDQIYGSTADNRLDAGAGDDTLFGDAGNDVLVGGSGADSIVGGSGVDTLDYSDSPNRVIVNMFGPTGGTVILGTETVFGATASDGHSFIDSITAMENVIGSAHSDFIQGGSNVLNVIEGGAGNDTLAGSGSSDSAPGAMDDTLLGGDGDDALRQTRGHDFIDGGDGVNDRLEFGGNNPLSGGMDYGSGKASVHVDLGEGFSNADRTDFDTVNGAGEDIAILANIERVFGTAGDDWLVGGSMARAGSGTFGEFFRGNAGNDTIDGDNGELAGVGQVNDTVDYSGNDNITGATGILLNFTPGTIILGSGATIEGGTARDGLGGTDRLIDISQVTGTRFNDVLFGGNPLNDNYERYDPRGGNDYINGGSGQDELSYSGAGGVVTVNLATGIAKDGFGGTDTFVGIERVRGSVGHDTMQGSGNAAVIETFIGEGGNDSINGGAGIDFASWQSASIASGGVNAFIENGSGTVIKAIGDVDTLRNIEGLIGTSSNDTLRGGAGNQRFRGRGGDDIIDGGAGVDTIDYTQDPNGVIVNLGGSDIVVGDDTVEAGTAFDGWGGIFELQGIDELSNIEDVIGSRHDDHITGGDADNAIEAGRGEDTVSGGDGNDRFVDSAASGDDLILGGEGNDTFAERTGNDTLEGNDGDDIFVADYTAEVTITASGGAGRDVYRLMPTQPGTVDYRVTDFDAGADGDFLDVAEILFASTKAGFYAGTDPFATGFLRLEQDGDDTLVQWDLDGAIGGTHTWVTAVRLVNIVKADVTLANFQGLQQGSVNPDSLSGTGVGDILLGLGGNDSLAGENGNDLLFGGAGVDSMVGGEGNDIYHVDDPNDKVIEESNGAGSLALPGGSGAGLAGLDGFTDTIIAAVNYSIGVTQRKFIENLSLTGTATKATGNALDNVLSGNILKNTLAGGAGHDTIDGGTGNDTMDGGTGNDVYFVNAAGDLVKEAATGGTGDTVHSTVTETLDLNVEHLVLIGVGNIGGNGNASSNTIVGNNGNNALDGKGGADTLDGGGGNDTLVWSSTDAYNGGVGFDSLRVLSGNLDLTAVPNTRIANVEQIDMTGPNDNRLTLTKQDILDLSSTTDVLTVIGNKGDSIDIVGALPKPTTANGFRTYKMDAAILLVDTDITVM